jgi:predicted DNA-binding antitoxin AbrB/MazE fold protein
MPETVTAVFEHGVFRPESPCDLPEGSRVVLAIQDEPKKPLSEEERRAIRRRVVARMRRSPLPADAPQFRRDDIYDRG